MAMFGAKDLSNREAKRSQSVQNKGNPHEKMIFSQKGLDGFPSKPNNNNNSFGSQEPNLHHLCEMNTKLGFAEKDFPGKTFISSFEKLSQNGKEIVFSSENSKQDHEKCVERGFFDLNETSAGNETSLKRGVVEEEVEFVRENSSEKKKQKMESLNLSLGLPDVSLSLTPSNAIQNIDSVHSRSACSNDISFDIPASLSYSHSHHQSQKTCSNDFSFNIPASLSNSHSHKVSHNPSCSLLRNSAENHEHSAGRIGHILCGGEGTNGSVHSQFRPTGDGVVALNNPPMVMQGNQAMNMDLCSNNYNHLYRRTTSWGNHSVLPPGLPPRPRVNTRSGDSRRRVSENLKGFGSVDDGGIARKVSKPATILRDIVCESISDMSQIIRRLSDEMLKSTKEYLKSIMAKKTKEFVDLQNRVNRRSDLTKVNLSKGHEFQLEILIAVKMGLESFLSGEIGLPRSELVEIFLRKRCRNVNCNKILPVDGCTCKICLANKGFCHACMCTVCLNFDCATNTCTWVGCDVCSHWCHAVCGIKKNHIKPGHSLNGQLGTSEMQFHCIGCGQTSAMFEFVKDAFLCCAQNWGLETLKKELDCIRKIFKGSTSDDIKGKELHDKVDELLSKLKSKVISRLDAVNSTIQFFNSSDDMSGGSKDSMATQASLRKDKEPVAAPPISLPPDYTLYNWNVLHQSDKNAAHMSALKNDGKFQFGEPSKKDGFGSKDPMASQASLRKDKEPVAPPTSLPPECTLYNWNVLHQNDKNVAHLSALKNDGNFQFGEPSKKDGFGSKDSTATQASLRNDKEPVAAPPTSLPSDYTLYNWNAHHQNDKNVAPKNDGKFQFGEPSKKDGFVNFESMIKMKEAEATLYQSKADEARREAEVHRPVIKSMSEKSEKEYVEQFSKLNFEETAERRRKKSEEVGVLKDSHDNTKLRMRELACLLESMAVIRQQQ